MVEKVKNEHYVPQRYLKHFANGENFFVFDKEKAEKRPGNVENYACERFFYDVDFEALNREISSIHHFWSAEAEHSIMSQYKDRRFDIKPFIFFILTYTL